MIIKCSGTEWESHKALREGELNEEMCFGREKTIIHQVKQADVQMKQVTFSAFLQQLLA